MAAGFGLVHGLAFANTLTNLHLNAGPMALSILGFSLGIELMQIFIIALVIPFLILLSRTPFYWIVRGAGLFWQRSQLWGGWPNGYRGNPTGYRWPLNRWPTRVFGCWPVWPSLP